MTKMSTLNSYPKPFTRQQNSREISNNCALNHEGNLPQSYRPTIEPTSTVHKSMAGTKQCNDHLPSYSRLISPTISQGSISPNYVANSNYQIQACKHVYEPVPQATSQQRSDVEQENRQNRHSPINLVKSPLPTTPITIESNSDRTIKDDKQANKHMLTRHEYVNQLINISPMDNSTVAKSPNSALLPDDRRQDYMRDKQLEQMSIAYQTYRTLPIVSPKPKARHDLAIGSYISMNQDPSWDLLRRNSTRPSNVHKFQQAISAIRDAKGGIQENNIARIHTNRIEQYSQQQKNDQSWQQQSNIYLQSNVQKQQINNVTGFNDKQHQEGQASRRGMAEDPVPAFDYRRYIESTRRAR